ncbi:MAG: FeoB-associated Cys-rich membrane protein [Odoribacter sp.]
MLQNIIVYIIIAIASGSAVYYGYHKWKILKKNKSCSSCSQCPLKNNCSKTTIERGDCKDKRH